MPLVFDGTDDRVSTANRNNGPTAYPFAVTAVVKVTTLSGSNADSIIQYGFGAFATAGFLLTVGDNATTGMQWWIGTVIAATSATLTPTGNWLFMGASSLNSTTHRIYLYNYETQSEVINATSTTSATFTNPSSSFFHIGMDTGDDVVYSDFQAGTLGYVAVYKKDFTISNGDAFRATAFLGPYAVGTPSNLWTFNEMTSTVTREQIAGGNDGTLTNFPASPWVEVGLPGPWWVRSNLNRVSRPAIVTGAAVKTRKTLMGVGM